METADTYKAMLDDIKRDMKTLESQIKSAKKEKSYFKLPLLLGMRDDLLQREKEILKKLEERTSHDEKETE